MIKRTSKTDTQIGRRITLAVALACAVAACVPAVAAATPMAWVSPAPVKGPFNNCATPGYNSIQEAITVSPAKSTIHVCAGTYTEEVVIQKPDAIAAEAGATLQLPGSPTATKSPCDKEPEEQDLLMVCTGGKVNISGLTLDGAWPTGTCNDNLYTVNTGGG